MKRQYCLSFVGVYGYKYCPKTKGEMIIELKISFIGGDNLKWAEAKSKAFDETLAYYELRPTGRVVTKEQYDYVLYYAKCTGINLEYVKTFEEVSGKFLQLGYRYGWRGGITDYFFFSDEPEGYGKYDPKRGWEKYHGEFSFGKFGKIEFE